MPLELTGPSSGTRHELPQDAANDHEAGSRDGTHDTTRTDDTRISAVRAPHQPGLVARRVAGARCHLELVRRARREISAILHGADDRLIVVVGPCSIHDHEQAMDYARRLKLLRDELADTLCIVMRVYFERSPHHGGLEGLYQRPSARRQLPMNEGLRLARQLLLDVNGLGLPAGTIPGSAVAAIRISDLIAWGAIGARTTESQSHRQLASGLSCPVGFKNGTDGGIKVASDAVLAAGSPHAFMGMTKMGVPPFSRRAAMATATSSCAAARHQVRRRLGGGRLRGVEGLRPAPAGDDRLLARQQQQAVRAPDRRRPRRGPQIAGRDRGITGVMIESHLEPGRQDLLPGQTKADLRPGVSITDACLGWSQTEPLLRAGRCGGPAPLADPSTGTAAGAAQAAPRALAQPLIGVPRQRGAGRSEFRLLNPLLSLLMSRPALMSAVIPLLVATGSRSPAPPPGPSTSRWRSGAGRQCRRQVQPDDRRLQRGG